jgi:sarcosine oxidase, subunit gamma
MSALALTLDMRRDRLGLKGPKAPDWLAAHGLPVPAAPNTWTRVRRSPGADGPFVARLGAAEFFLEDAAAGGTLERIAPPAAEHPPGVFPLLREDWAYDLAGDAVHEVLAQVCNVNFAALTLDSRPLIMTMMIGVAVLVVPQAAAGGREYRIWCDPTFGPYLGESLGTVVIDCGGRYTGAAE